jgi:hypothetical protein
VRAVSARDVGLLDLHIRPDFVALNALAGQIPHLLIVKGGAAVSDLDHQAHDRVAVSVGHPLG